MLRKEKVLLERRKGTWLKENLCHEPFDQTHSVKMRLLTRMQQFYLSHHCCTFSNDEKQHFLGCCIFLGIGAQVPNGVVKDVVACESACGKNMQFV